MSRYVDGYVLPVPKKNLNAYRSMARDGRARSGAITARSSTSSAWRTT